MNLLRYVLIAAALSSTTAYAMAEVTRIEIATRTDVLAGKAFGDTGPYEEIVGTLDPDNPSNKSIADPAAISSSAATPASVIVGSAGDYILFIDRDTFDNGSLAHTGLRRPAGDCSWCGARVLGSCGGFPRNVR
jgi:hypothetical protein